MPEIRIYTVMGQIIEIKEESLPKDIPVKDLAANIARDGFSIGEEKGGSLINVARVDYTEGIFSPIVVASGAKVKQFPGNERN